MATANIDLQDGTRIVIEGSPDEIVRVLELYGRVRPASVPTTRASKAAVPRGASARAQRESSGRARTGVMQHIRDLINDGFFSERRSISHVQTKLEELGRIYPLTHLSTPLRRLVVSKELRRLREGKNWAYVDAR